MAWQDEMVTLLRTLIADDGTAQTYTDDRLEGATVAAARLVAMELGFPVTYLANASDVTIVPDPTVAPDRDENFINLSCVRAACIIDNGSAIKAAGQALMVKDGQSQVDLRDRYKAMMALLDKGWCAAYGDMKDQYIISQHGVVVGAAILTPFRVYATGAGDQPFLTNYDPRWMR